MSAVDGDSKVLAAFIASSEIGKTDWDKMAELSGRWANAKSASVNFSSFKKKYELFNLMKDPPSLSPTKASPTKGPISPKKPAGVTKKTASPKKNNATKGRKNSKKDLNGFINDDDESMDDQKHESDAAVYNSDNDLDLDGMPLKSE